MFAAVLRADMRVFTADVRALIAKSSKKLYDFFALFAVSKFKKMKNGTKHSER